MNSRLNSYKTDMNYFFEFLTLFVKFVCLFPFRVVFIFLFFFINNKRSQSLRENMNKDLKNLFKLPFLWVFEAKSIIFIIFLISLGFLLQIFVLKDYGAVFAHSSTDLFNLDRFYTIVTSIFLHGSFYHFLGNVFALFVFGRTTQKYLKNYTFLFFVFIGVFANLVSDLIYLFFLKSSLVSWGASGAIAGIIMFTVLIEPLKFSFFFGIPLPHFLIGWFLIFTDLTLLNSNDGVSHYVHLAGYASILIFVSFFKTKHKSQLQRGFVLNLFMIFLLFFIYLLFPDLTNLSNYYNTFLQNLDFKEKFL